jgi:hypothetical protein
VAADLRKRLSLLDSVNTAEAGEIPATAGRNSQPRPRLAQQ